MVSTSKILTVSYGTFSCTLEGFDDAFDTMKAIAEYFRDLAADDRYFGAEPPTPDAEMLARIAEREIARRVEARQDETGIVLRASAQVRATGALTPAAYEAPTDEREETAPQAEPASRAGQAEPDAAPEPTAIQAEKTPDQAAPPKETLIAADRPAAPEPDQPAVATDKAKETDFDAEDEPDSVAARLRRIRSVVAQSGEGYGAQFSEDEHAQDFLARTATELDMALDDDTAEEIAGESAEDWARDWVQDWSAPQGHDTAEQPPETTPAGDEPDEDTPAEPAAGMTEELVELDRAGSDDDADDEDAFADAVTEDTLSQLLADAMPDSADDEQAQMPAAAGRSEPRVLKLTRGEFAAAIEQRGLEEMPPDAPEAAPEAVARDDEDEAPLSSDEEAELLRELAEVEAEFDAPAEHSNIFSDTRDADADDADLDADLDADRSDVADSAAPAPRDHPEEAGRGAHLQTSGADSNAARIFDKADSQFDAPDSSRRRNAIQHLRAAVAASKAEIKAGGTLNEGSGGQEAAFRSDLAQVVRPRRPTTALADDAEGTARSRRPAESRPAPLKLVAEQRIDTPQAPVRPRRVAAAGMPAAATTGNGEGFAEFADGVGATDLPDLLEAAAAFLADAEGREQFSRPMLMGKLKEVRGAAFSREEGLRSFGHLLRQGKLQKLKGGRFTVTDQTEFRAQARRAG